MYSMDSKRKSPSDDPSFSLHDLSKRPKVRAYAVLNVCMLTLMFKRSKQLPPDEAMKGRNSIQSHLIMLEHLTREIMNSPESMQNQATGARSDIIKAATQLDAAFRRARNPSPPTGEAASSVADRASVPVNDNRTFGNHRGQCLPVLPPISNQSLEKAVFTHPGVSNDLKTTYDRLEILGDAYIELIATKIVWDMFPDLSSGRISQIRELLVKNETLSEYASMYGFDRRAVVPQDYLKQPKRWIKTKGDIFEAYVAAVILSDSIDGYRAVEKWLSQLWAPKLTGLDNRQVNLQAKEALAKKIMGKGVKLKYVDERPSVQLKGGMQTFYVGVYLTGWGWTNKHLGSGEGLNKSIAGDQAARAALLNTSLISEIAAIKRTWDGSRKI